MSLQNKLPDKRDLDFLRKKASDLPRSPGVYIMHGNDGKVIYVGKSRTLHDRVSQYFHGSHDLKTSIMSSKVFDFEYIICKTEMEALALENRLIKQHKPKYNIKLKDSKSYPYIKIQDISGYPNISITRTRSNDNAKYFGPYSSINVLYSMLSSVEKILGIPTCRKKFPDDIGKGRPCINYQIGNCIGLCKGDVPLEEYRKLVSAAESVLKGDTSGVIGNLTEEMYRQSDMMEYEKAAKYRNIIASLKKLGDQQVVVSSPDSEYDVFGMYSGTGGQNGGMSVFLVRNGYIADRYYFPFSDDETALLESDDRESSLVSFISGIYQTREYVPKTILLSFPLADDEKELLQTYLEQTHQCRCTVKIPVRGDLRKLCTLTVDDAREHTMNYEVKATREEKLLVSIASLLHLEVLPERIESYDISNYGNENITAGMIVAMDGKFKRSEYRLFKMRSVSRQDDYASMEETLRRRLSHIENTGEKSGMAACPDLILLDGGTAHVNVVKQVLEDMSFDIPLFGMVKNDYHRTRALVDVSGNEIDISRHRDIFNFIYNIQEEVHRYTVRNMTKAKRKTLTRSSLESVPGIGPAKAKILLKHFGSIKNIKAADSGALSAVKGISSKDAENILKYFSLKG